MVPGTATRVRLWTSLRTEIVLKVIVMTTGIVALVSLAAFKILEVEVLRQRIQGAERLMHALDSEMGRAEPLFPGSSPRLRAADLQRVLDLFVGAGNLRSLCLVGSDGFVRAHADPSLIHTRMGDPLITRALATGKAVSSLSESARALPDSARALSDSAHALSDSAHASRGTSGRGTALPESARALSDSAHASRGTSGRGTALSESARALSDSARASRGTSGRGTALPESARALSDSAHASRGTSGRGTALSESAHASRGTSGASFLAPLLGSDVRIALALTPRGGERLVGVAVVPLSDVRRSIVRSGRVLLAFILLDAFLLVVFGSWFLSRAVVRPLDRLSHAAEAIASGDLGHRVPVDRANEIGLLGRAFNDMAERLKESRDRVEDQLDRLERANSELARAQADLLRSEKLASVGRLSAGLAHEIGNPLSAILGLADILLLTGGPPPAGPGGSGVPLDPSGGRQGMTGGPPPAGPGGSEVALDPSGGRWNPNGLPGGPLEGEAREYMEQIRKETERIHGILRRLLDFSRPHRTEFREVDVNETIRETMRLAQPMADLRPVRVRLELDPAASHVQADPALLQQVLLNLVMNAAHAMPDGGTLTIATRNAPFDTEETIPARPSGGPVDPDIRLPRQGLRKIRPGDPGVEIGVADTGCGIPPGHLTAIFDPFFTTKAPGRGTGLGLSVVHGIVETLRGQIRVQSDVGKGTTFRLWLPTGREAA